VLKEQVDKLDFLKNTERTDDYTNVKCFIKTEKKFNIYIFSNIYENKTDLENNWHNLNNDIAYFFQSKLELSIERWNLYIVYFVKQQISKRLKYSIEQNKYCARKLVIDNFDLREYEENLDEIIQNKIFDIVIGSQKECTYESIATLIKDSDERLLKLLLNPNIDIKNIIKQYLEEDIYED